MLGNKVSFIMLSIYQYKKLRSTCRMNKQNGCEMKEEFEKNNYLV